MSSKKISTKVFIIVLFSSLINGCMSTEPYKPIELVNVVELNDIGQEKIFNQTRQWFSEYFVSGESVIDYEDKSVGTIIGNGIADVGSDTFGIINYGIKYTLKVETKDGKLRVTTKINQFTNSDSTNGTYNVANVSEDRILAAEAEVNSMVKSLQEYIQKDNGASW